MVQAFLPTFGIGGFSRAQINLWITQSPELCHAWTTERFFFLLGHPVQCAMCIAKLSEAASAVESVLPTRHHKNWLGSILVTFSSSNGLNLDHCKRLVMIDLVRRWGLGRYHPRQQHQASMWPNKMLKRWPRLKSLFFLHLYVRESPARPAGLEHPLTRGSGLGWVIIRLV